MKTKEMPRWTRLTSTPLRVSERKEFLKVGGQVTTPASVFEFLRRSQAEEVEVFYVLALNSQHQVIGVTELTRGVLNASLVAPREVFRWAIAMNARSVIVAHNHPSGNPGPSGNDRAVTRSLVEAGRLLEIPVVDHLIIGDDEWFSFAEAGELSTILPKDTP